MSLQLSAIQATALITVIHNLPTSSTYPTVESLTEEDIEVVLLELTLTLASSLLSYQLVHASTHHERAAARRTERHTCMVAEYNIQSKAAREFWDLWMCTKECEIVAAEVEERWLLRN